MKKITAISIMLVILLNMLLVFPMSEIKAVETIDIVVSNNVAGSLSSNINNELLAQSKAMSDINSITVTGNLSQTDLNWLTTNRASLTEITELNLEGANAIGLTIPTNFMNERTTLTSFSFPNGIVEIGIAAFNSCKGLTGNLVIPDGVTSIGNQAFYYCTGFNGTLTIPNSVTTIGTYAFAFCSNLTGPLIIPNNMTIIYDAVFWNCSNLTGDLVIPEGVTRIGNSAFQNCSKLNGTLTIPNSVNTILNSAFAGCSSLTGDLVIPDGVTSIGISAFQNCSKFDGDLVISDGLTKLADDIFSGCSGLTGNLKFPNGITQIGNKAFSGCSNLTGDLEIPSNVTSIGERAFYNCIKLTGDITIPSGITTIGGYTFAFCTNIKGKLTLPNELITIGEAAFWNSGITGSITIPNTVTTIGGYAFQNCTGISDITVPYNVTLGASSLDGIGNTIRSLKVTFIYPSSTEVQELEEVKEEDMRTIVQGAGVLASNFTEGHVTNGIDIVKIFPILPTGSINVNNGVEWVNSQNVTLNLSASSKNSEVAAMKFSNNGINWTAEEPYTTTKEYMLSSGDELKTIYVMYKNSNGLWSEPYSVTVLLDSSRIQVSTTGTRVTLEGNLKDINGDIITEFMQISPEITVVLTNTITREQYNGILRFGQPVIFRNLDYGTYEINCINPLDIKFIDTDATGDRFTLSNEYKTHSIKVNSEYTVKSGFYSIMEKNNLFNSTLPPENGYEGGYVNMPKLADGMIPVKWNETYSMWEQTTTDNPDWYNYVDTIKAQKDNIDADKNKANYARKWANVMLGDYIDSNGDNEPDIDGNGMLIPQNMGSMYVWIPRYTYKIIAGEGKGSSELAQYNGAGKINIKFSNGIVDDISNGYIKHPAFYFGEYTEAIDDLAKNRNTGYTEGGKELTGIWIAKFELSTGAYNIFQSKPSVSSKRDATTDYFFNESLKITRENASYYKISEGELDSFMMRNRDWGAVTYLSQAIGIQAKMKTNPIYNAGGSNTVGQVYGANVKMSTTGTPYGIYDMAGAGEDVLAAYTDNGVDNGSIVYKADPKYKDVFKVSTVSDSHKNNLIQNKNKKGMATSEICNPNIAGVWGFPQSWYGGIIYIPEASNKFFMARGGDVTHETQGITGLYTMYARSQAGAGYMGSRTVIVNMK